MSTDRKKFLDSVLAIMVISLIIGVAFSVLRTKGWEDMTGLMIFTDSIITSGAVFIFLAKLVIVR